MQAVSNFVTSAFKLGETAVGFEFSRRNNQDVLASQERQVGILAASQERQTSQIVTGVIILLGLSMVMKKARG